MRLRYIAAAWRMSVRELLRSRIAVILFLIIPTLFYAVILLTTTHKEIVFRLASVSEEMFIRVSQRQEALVFIGLAAVGLLTSFLALNLTQKHADANRRLILCGYTASELLSSKFLTLAGLIVGIGVYISILLLLFFEPRRLPLVFLGFMLAGFVYGCYGLMIGAIFRRELEGILLIVLLANIDIGWLQNPIYYADAQNTFIIRHLPAYFPSQVSMTAAFSGHSILAPLGGSLFYGGLLLLAAGLVFAWKMRIRK
ncbi:MAG: hypothetical protein H6P98_800 [Candidatus Aminicenantes bacterium]|jgi:hypothetical protein|nr:hypothetical protein [Candidatus Aminicenantes bacterium]